MKKIAADRDTVVIEARRSEAEVAAALAAPAPAPKNDLAAALPPIWKAAKNNRFGTHKGPVGNHGAFFRFAA